MNFSIFNNIEYINELYNKLNLFYNQYKKDKSNYNELKSVINETLQLTIIGCDYITKIYHKQIASIQSYHSRILIMSSKNKNLNDLYKDEIKQIIPNLKLILPGKILYNLDGIIL